MADAGSLVVKLVTDIKDFSKGFADAETKIKGFVGETGKWFDESKVAIASAVGAIAAEIALSIKAYGESEQAITRLNQALHNQGIRSKSVSEELQKFASQLQSVTTFSDEAVMGVQAMLVNMGLTGEALRSATIATLNYAAATGKDAAEGVNLLGQAVAGRGMELKRYGIDITDAKTGTERMAIAVNGLNQKFAGQAEAMRQTTLGGFVGMKNALDDLQEVIGSMLAGPASSLVNWLTQLLVKLRDSLSFIIQVKTEMGGFANFLANTFILLVAAVLQAINDILGKIPGVSFLLQKIGIDLQANNQWIEEQAVKIQGTINAWTGLGNKAVDTNTKTATSTVQANATIQASHLATQKQYSLFNDQRLQAAQAEARDRVSLADKMYTALSDYAGTWTDFAIDRAKAVTDGMAKGVSDMILEGKKFKEVLEGLWKEMAAAFIQQVARMIAKWLAFQALKAAGTGGFGGFFAEGGIISEPSVITGLKSGITHIAGEAGPEVIMPMSKFHGAGQNQSLNQAGAGPDQVVNNITVSVQVQGQMIEADESKWQKVVNEKIVPAIRRFTAFSPVGPFTRRRGAT